jgi:hypothetical protein
MLGHAKASMTLDVYADLVDEDPTALRSGSTRRSGLLRPHRGPRGSEQLAEY